MRGSEPPMDSRRVDGEVVRARGASGLGFRKRDDRRTRKGDLDRGTLGVVWG